MSSRILSRSLRQEVERFLWNDVQHFGLLPLDYLDEGPKAVIDPHKVERLVAWEPLGQSRGPLGGRRVKERQQSFARLHLFVRVQLLEHHLGTPMESIVVNVQHPSRSGSPANRDLS